MKKMKCAILAFAAIVGLCTTPIQAKAEEDKAGARRKAILQNIVDVAKENNVCRFNSVDGTTAQFAKDGSFRMRVPEGVSACN